MGRLVAAEWAKGRHSFVRSGLWLFPLLVCALAIVLMGGQLVQVGAFNWWYVMLLPAYVALFCAQLAGQEKKTAWFNMLALPVAPVKMWRAKIYMGCGYLLLSNLMVFLFTSISGFLFGTQYALWQGVAAALVLTVTFAWQVPLGLLLAARFGPVAAFLGILVPNIVFSSQTFAGGALWLVPFATPARLMAPLIGVNPNGVPVEMGSPLADPGVLLPGLLLTGCLFVVACLLLPGRFLSGGEHA